MAKDFSGVINEIMPLVESGSDLPFAITREDGNWNINYFALNTTAEPDEIKAQAEKFLAFLREKDPYTVRHTGEDFAKGSFPYVYDKVFCARLRAEYEAGAFGRASSDELNALINAVEDYIGSISQQTIDYLLEFDQPLRALYELNPIPLYNRDNSDGEPYNDDKINDFIEAVESKITELIERPNVEPAARQESDNRAFSDAKVNEYDPRHIITSLLLNGVDIELGEDTENPLSFYVESNRGYDNLFSFRTDNYPEAIKTYTSQILDHVYEMSLDREDKAVTRGVDFVKLTDEHCLPDGKNADFTGKLIIVDANSLLPEYRSSTSQLVECSHGNGARPGAIGRSVFGTELFSGASVVYDRSNILGIADESRLPQWAKVKLEIQRDPAVFEYGGFHFKPYRQFQKGEVDKPLKGDSRPWKTDAAYAMRNMSSDRSLAISSYDWGKTDYSHDKLYAAANSEADIFMCLENGRLYVPCANELFQYTEPPQKEQAKTAADRHKDKPREGSAEKPDFLAKINDNKQKVERDKSNADAPAQKKKRDGQEV